MKKLTYVLLSFVLFSCGTYRALDLNKLTTGMTKAEVMVLVGEPDRVLAVNQTKDGYQEILEYRTSRDEVYALEFWDDYLTGYEFLYDDVLYVPSVVPPVWYPEPGRPVFPGYRPGKPYRPGNSGRPGGSGNTGRPRPSQPDSDKSGLTKPAPGREDQTRPSTPSTTRPSTPSTTRPTTPSTTRPSTTRPSTPSTTRPSTSTPRTSTPSTPAPDKTDTTK